MLYRIPAADFGRILELVFMEDKSRDGRTILKKSKKTSPYAARDARDAQAPWHHDGQGFRSRKNRWPDGSETAKK
ncbi:MAG: hypothetical protein ACKV19_05285 [Verrucomicrobiales bacterium]